MEVGRIVIVKVHSDNDTVESTDLRHCPLAGLGGGYLLRRSSISGIVRVSQGTQPDLVMGTSKNLNGMGGWGKGHDHL